jgi:hypothetical protein
MGARGSLVLLLLAGCGAASGTSSPGHPLECGPVITSLMARSKEFASQVMAGQQFDMSSQVNAVVDSYTPVLVQSCRQDHWSDELLACLDDMSVTDDPHKCNHYFTQDQAVALARRFLAAMTPRTRAPAAQ